MSEMILTLVVIELRKKDVMILDATNRVSKLIRRKPCGAGGRKFESHPSL